MDLNYFGKSVLFSCPRVSLLWRELPWISHCQFVGYAQLCFRWQKPHQSLSCDNLSPQILFSEMPKLRFKHQNLNVHSFIFSSKRSCWKQVWFFFNGMVAPASLYEISVCNLLHLLRKSHSMKDTLCTLTLFIDCFHWLSNNKFNTSSEIRKQFLLSSLVYKARKGKRP